MTSNRLLLGVTLGLLAWGSYLAIGGWLGGAYSGGVHLEPSYALRRGAMIFGFPALFLLGWWRLLLSPQHLQRLRNRQARYVTQIDQQEAFGVTDPSVARQGVSAESPAPPSTSS